MKMDGVKNFDEFFNFLSVLKHCLWFKFFFDQKLLLLTYCGEVLNTKLTGDSRYKIYNKSPRTFLYLILYIFVFNT